MARLQFDPPEEFPVACTPERADARAGGKPGGQPFPATVRVE